MINIEKRVNPVWKETQNIEVDLAIVGKEQQFFSNKKGKISLIELPNYFRNGVDLWEIYCLEGNLIDDIERFTSQKEAIKRIYELLGEIQ